MTNNVETFDAQQIAQAWKDWKTIEHAYRREVLYAQRRVARMIASRSCSLQNVADLTGTSRAYPKQLADRFLSGDIERRIGEIENGAAA